MMESGEECGHEGDHVTAGTEAKEGDWQKAWYDGDLKDANRETTQWLIDNIDKLTGGKPNCRILVPMCGAARDMHWLLEQGHEVIGLDLVDKALQIFLARHSIKHTVSEVPSIPDGKCYKSDDGKLTLYRCNVFDLDTSLIGQLDGVWDCGAMTDIPPKERIQYGEMILSGLSPGGRILAETFSFGETKKEGESEYSHDNDHSHDHSHDHGHDHGHGDGDEEFDFPCRPVEMADFERMYGKCCSIELLVERDSEYHDAKEWGPNWWAKDRLHLIILQDESSASGGERKRSVTGEASGGSEEKKTKDDDGDQK